MFKAVGPLWAQATAGRDNAFKKIIKTGKKVLRRFLKKKRDPEVQSEIPTPTWSLRTQNVQVGDCTNSRLIGGLFPKELLRTQAAELRRQAALRFIRDSRKVPVFAFVGLSLGVGAATNQTKHQPENYDVLCSGIRDLFKKHGVKENIVGGGSDFSLETLQLGHLIGKGSNAAVYEARYSANSLSDQKEAVGLEAEENCVGGDVSEQEEDSGSKIHAEVLPEQSLNVDNSVGDTETITTEDVPPSVFHTDNHMPLLEEVDDDDDSDFWIIDEPDLEEKSPDAEPNYASACSLDGWVMYRVSSLERSEGCVPDGTADFDNDIYILATDGDGLESIPDLEDEENILSLTEQSPPPVAESETDQVTKEWTDSSGSDTVSSTTCQSTLSTGSSSNVSVLSNEPEPAPNIQESGEDFPLAVKMMYNYSVESQADRILSAMARETVPAQTAMSQSLPGRNGLDKKRLPPHPNIVTMHGVFVDQTPDLPEGNDVYPSALPPRLNKEGFGRNATMFLVMKKYAMTLDEYLANYDVNMHTRCLLFAQLLEGVAHLSKHEIAHRDLKSNNILIDLSQGTDQPSLAVSDFGCCLADTRYGLKLPYLTDEMGKGGNGALMAPEIKCAEPGPDNWLDFSKADLWAAGTLAHEIFGCRNPFYTSLDARSYSEEALPELSEDTPEVIRKLVELMLKKDPSERPTPAVAATIMQLFLWAPSQLHPLADWSQTGCNAVWKCKELCHWLEQLTMETVCLRVFGNGIPCLDLQVKTAFLSRISWQDIYAVLGFVG